jgi:G3E family GTPase
VTQPLPVTVIGGYLGAGKTTLVNHLLRHAGGTRLAVMVNDFGELPIDADLIEARAGNLINIAGGCICCSFGSDLMEALAAMARFDPAPDCVLIETSGVAMPGLVARSATLVAPFAIDGVVVLADAGNVRERATDRYMGDTITRQLAEADLVVLNKTDLVPAGALAGLREWIGEVAPRARMVEAVRAVVPFELLFGLGHSPVASGILSSGALRPVADAASQYESAHFKPPRGINVTLLANALSVPALGVIRAKGILVDQGGVRRTLHVVGARREVATAGTGSGDATGLVCIGIKGRLDHAAIGQALRKAAVTAL